MPAVMNQSKKSSIELKILRTKEKQWTQARRIKIVHGGGVTFVTIIDENGLPKMITGKQTTYNWPS